jgi:hypothetical protein
MVGADSGMGGMVATETHLRLHDRDNSAGLGDGRKACKSVGLYLNGSKRRAPVANLDSGTELGEPGTRSIVLLAALLEVVKTLHRDLAVRARNGAQTGIDLDTRDDTLALQDLQGAQRASDTGHQSTQESTARHDSAAENYNSHSATLIV